MKFDLSKSENVLIVGAGHGIGLSLAKECLKRNKDAKILCTYRVEEKALELIELSKHYNQIHCYQVESTEEESLDEFFNKIKDSSISVDLLINCIGLLHHEKMLPEKSLKDLSVSKLMESFLVNSVVSAMLAKKFETILDRDKLSCFVSLSAKVGSIEDNRMGGWYSYRASKAALNMILRNVSIEFKRRRKNCIVLALHPGTTETELSKPFIGGTSYKLHTPDETAENLINVLNDLSLDDTGKFLSWDGQEIPW